MSDTRVKKIFDDIRTEGSRSLLVILAISVGLFTFASVLDARAILVRELDVNYLKTDPAAAILEIGSGSDSAIPDQSTLDKVRSTEGVKDATLSGEITARIRVPGRDWQPIRLFILSDFLEQKSDLITSDRGSWPPLEGETLIERAAIPMLGTDGSEFVEIRLSDGINRTVRNAGVVHAPGLPPAWMERTGYAWISAETAKSWGIAQPLNRMSLRVSGTSMDTAYIGEVATQVRFTLNAAGINVRHIAIPKPGHHPHATQMLTLLYLLETFGFLAMILAAILTASMINSLMSRQLRQIAVMKAIGGTASQIRVMYFCKIALFASVSCLIALPLAKIAAIAYSRFSAGLLNFDIFDASVPFGIYLVEVAVSFGMPLLVTAYPVIKGSRISVREGISDTGTIASSITVEKKSGTNGRFNRALALSLRNAFRNPLRLCLTILTLSAAGAIFITAMNVGASMDASVIAKFRTSRYDIRVMLPVSVTNSALSELSGTLPQIETLETWGYNQVCRMDEMGRESENVDLVSIPEKTVLQGSSPTITGRWLTENDTDSIVMNQRMLSAMPDCKIGDRVVLRINGTESRWTVVGVVQEIMAMPTCYANKSFVDSLLGQEGRSRIFVVRARSHDLESVTELGNKIESALGERGIPIVSLTRLLDFQMGIQEHFRVIAAMLTLMALLVVVVGVLGLSSAMGINVLERTRELGILRAIGAGRKSVVIIVVTEGMAVGLASWFVALIASWPVSGFIAERFGMLFFEAPLVFAVSVQGMFLWLALVLFCSALASYFPAARTASVPIRETLAWE
jgi:putative ABC transport system permease protein